MAPTTEEGYSYSTLPGTNGASLHGRTFFKRVYSEFPNSPRENPCPLVIVHGGPFLGHDYCWWLHKLAYYPNVSHVIFYDQFGAGKSTHMKDLKGAPAYWPLMVLQLANLVEDLQLASSGFHLVAHSFGTVIGATFAAEHPKGLRSLILINATVSAPDVANSNRQLLKTFPADTEHAIVDFEEHVLGLRKETSVSPETYQAAADAVRSKHFCKYGSDSEYLQKSLENLAEVMDDFAALCGGRIMFLWGGPLAEYSAAPILHKIAAPTLVVKGEDDQLLPMCQKPLLENIPHVEEITLDGYSHMGMIDRPNWMTHNIAPFLEDKQ